MCTPGWTQKQKQVALPRLLSSLGLANPFTNKPQKRFGLESRPITRHRHCGPGGKSHYRETKKSTVAVGSLMTMPRSYPRPLELHTQEILGGSCFLSSWRDGFSSDLGLPVQAIIAQPHPLRKPPVRRAQSARTLAGPSLCEEAIARCEGQFAWEMPSFRQQSGQRASDRSAQRRMAGLAARRLPSLQAALELNPRACARMPNMVEYCPIVASGTGREALFRSTEKAPRFTINVPEQAVAAGF